MTWRPGYHTKKSLSGFAVLNCNIFHNLLQRSGNMTGGGGVEKSKWVIWEREKNISNHFLYICQEYLHLKQIAIQEKVLNPCKCLTKNNSNKLSFLPFLPTFLFRLKNLTQSYIIAELASLHLHAYLNCFAYVCSISVLSFTNLTYLSIRSRPHCVCRSTVSNWSWRKKKGKNITRHTVPVIFSSVWPKQIKSQRCTVVWVFEELSATPF